MAAARVDGRVCVFVEPIALYHARDLFPGDGAWAFPLPPQGEAIAIGEVGVYEDGALVAAPSGAADLVVLTYGNGVPMALRTAKKLRASAACARASSICAGSRRSPRSAIRAHAERGARDPRRRRVPALGQRVGGDRARCLAESPALRDKPFARVTSADSFIPLAEAANLVLLQEPEIYAAAIELAAASGSARRASATTARSSSPTSETASAMARGSSPARIRSRASADPMRRSNAGMSSTNS